MIASKKLHILLFPSILFFLALGVRLVYLQGLQDNPLFDTFPQAFDHFNFDQGATNFAQGDWLANAANNSYSPLYKYFLGVLYLISGRNFYFIYTVQFCMGALASVLVYLITKNLFGTRAGIFAFLGLALYSTQIIYEGILLRAAFISFWGLVSFYLLSRLPDSFSLRSLVPATLALSLFFQARPNTLLCLPLICVFLYKYVFHSLQPAERKRSWGVFGGVLLISFIPLLVQCYLVHDRFVFFDASGPHTFIAGNLTTYSGVSFDPQVIEAYTKESALGYASNIQYLFHHITGDFIGFIKLYLRKLYFFFNDFEAPSNISVYVYREFSSLVPWLLNHFALFSALGLVGIVLAVRKKKKAFLLYSYTLSLTLAILIFLNEARYRIPVAPYYIIFSAYAADSILTALSRRKFREAVAVVAMAAVLFVSFLIPEKLQPVRQVDYCNMGNSYLNHQRLSDLQKAENFAIKCWEVERKMDLDHTFSKPLLSTIYNLYASYLFKNGKPSEAEKISNHSLEVLPSHSYPFKLLAEIYQSRNETDSAIRSILQGIAAEPDDKILYKILFKLYNKNENNDFKEYVTLVRLLSLEKDESAPAILQRELQSLSQKIHEKTKGLNLSVDQARAWYLKEQWELAVPGYAQVNKYNIGNDTLFLEQGIIYGSLERYEEALNALYFGLLINPENKNIHKVLADYYLRVTKKPPLAFIHLRRYLHLPEETGEYRKRKKWFEQLRYQYGTQKRSRLIGPLTPKENREIYNLYKK